MSQNVRSEFKIDYPQVLAVSSGIFDAITFTLNVLHRVLKPK